MPLRVCVAEPQHGRYEQPRCYRYTTINTSVARCVGHWGRLVEGIFSFLGELKGILPEGVSVSFCLDAGSSGPEEIITLFLYKTQIES